jgi:tol-pal system protein YbgF
MTRMAAVLFALLFAAPAAAQDSVELGQMRLYAQQLEERVRLLTGQNDQLLYELNRLRATVGQPQVQSAEQLGATASVEQPPSASTAPGAPAALPGAPGAPQDIGSLSVAAGDPLIAPDGAGDLGQPIDLSTLAGGAPALPAEPGLPVDPTLDPTAPAGTLPDSTFADQPAGPTTTAALSGSARDEYDLAYGYILTGDYGLAEQAFQRWLAAFPGDPQARDAEFWLAESQLQQGEYRDAANSFLALYKAAPEGAKAPDALLRLGMSLSALGERSAACATLAEVGRKYPAASASLMSRVDDEVERAGC